MLAIKSYLGFFFIQFSIRDYLFYFVIVVCICYKGIFIMNLASKSVSELGLYLKFSFHRVYSSLYGHIN
ncbi:hypothetical protein QVD17_11287 [Tagetes erecta]|uniref:Uncharacterized protein n=1 Tax=Tagetes erecta TaxID=13708 RepID=A0AAD8KXM3_TARER|nr:hypothetical protein QVD17_11287 [Tagetes erecta]